MTQLYCLGFNYQTTPIALRERLAPVAGSRFRPVPQGELVVLATCNRLELYATLPAATRHPFASLRQFLAETTGVPLSNFTPHLYEYTGVAVVRHLSRVACGLDSMVLGEGQILGQVARAGAEAQPGGLLAALFATAVRAGKRARSETAIGRGEVSVASAAIRQAARVVPSWPAGLVVVVGAGEMAQLVVKRLRSAGVVAPLILNRSVATARRLAERWEARAASLDAIPAALEEASVLFAATAAPGPLVTAEMLPPARQAPLALVDLAVPRNIAPGAAAHPAVRLLNIDDIQDRVAAGLDRRLGAVPAVESIVDEAVAAWPQRARQVEAEALIARLRRQAEATRCKEVERALSHLPDADAATRQQLERLTRSLVNKLLHQPTGLLRRSAVDERGEEVTALASRLYGLKDG